MTAEQCYLYLDVRLTPVQTAMDVQAELRAARRAGRADRAGVHVAGAASRPKASSRCSTHPCCPPRRVRVRSRRGLPAALQHVARHQSVHRASGSRPSLRPGVGVGGGLFWAEADDFVKPPGCTVGARRLQPARMMHVRSVELSGPDVRRPPAVLPWQQGLHEVAAADGRVPRRSGCRPPHRGAAKNGDRVSSATR